MEKLKTKYKAYENSLLSDVFEVHDVMNVNFKPHPFTIGPRHVSLAADRYCGRLGEEVVKQIGCAAKGCDLPYEKHTSDLVLFLKLKRDTTVDEVQKILSPLQSELVNDKIDGISFIETEKKYRIL